MADNSSQDVGDLLLIKGVLTEEQFDTLRRHQRSQGASAQQAALELNLAPEPEITRSLSELHSLEFNDLEKFTLTEELTQAVPVNLILHYRFIPIALTEETVTIARGDPLNNLELANLKLLLKREIRLTLAPPSNIEAIIKSQFGLGAETVEKLRDDKDDQVDEQEAVFDLSEEFRNDDGTIPELVDQLLAEALTMRATDIHFEPSPQTVRLRYRIDGILQTVPIPAKLRPLYTSIVSRLKIMSSLDISERRLPQDGRIAMKTKGESYDLRLSIIPTKHGESLCLRILGRERIRLGFEELGMLPFQKKIFSRIPTLPQGFILISGPTGSGKTTTLYAALKKVNDGHRKIITIEDPVEYQIEGIVQMQTHESIGLTFSQGLRAILRHDPDVVLVGEIRDRETADIAVRASQTGHLVFSTIHANDSINAIPRLLDMGVDANSLAASLNCSIAQRLSRRICRHCSVPDPDPDPAVLEEMTQALELPPDQLLYRKGEGCSECRDTGVTGRIAIYELAPVDEALAEAIHDRHSVAQLRMTATKNGWKSLRQVAFHRVQDQSISLSELQQMTWRLEFSQA